MKVRFLTCVVGRDLSWSPGQVVDLPDAEAMKWADGERAEMVEEPSREPPPTDPEQPEEQAPATEPKPKNKPAKPKPRS